MIYSEPVASAFRTIEGARADQRVRVFELLGSDAIKFGEIAGIERAEIIDRLESIAVDFGWSPEERQRLIAAACARAERTHNEIIPEQNGLGHDDVARPPEFSDEALALRLAECHDDLLYVAALGSWYIWDGTRFLKDDTLATRDKVRQTCRAIAASCGEDKARIAKAIASAKTVAGVERLAQADRRIAARVEQFDADGFVLNTPSGVFDLRSGTMRAHDRRLYLTKITGAAPDFHSPKPTWDAFLHRITAGDRDLIGYLQRVAGYSLTGSTQEHALFFCYGVGANGKSTFLNALTAAAGDYHRAAPIEAFTSSNHDRHPTDLAGLRGARLVTSVETEEGRRWAESRIKSLTGGDKISARFMRQDFFEYVPQFKLIIAGNHKPGLRSVDEAIRRRFNLIPFAVTIPDHERDEQLGDKIAAELPGILAWAIAGCAQWLQHGLAPPRAVIAATAAYLESEDAVAAWVDEAAERDGNSFTKSSDLFASWSTWAERAGEYVGSAKRLGQALETRGFVPHRHRQLGRGFLGVRLADVPIDQGDGN